MHWCFTMRIKWTNVNENMWIYYIVIAVNLLHVSITSCGHLQGRVFMKNILQRQPNQFTYFHMHLLIIFSQHPQTMFPLSVTDQVWHPYKTLTNPKLHTEIQQNPIRWSAWHCWTNLHFGNSSISDSNINSVQAAELPCPLWDRNERKLEETETCLLYGDHLRQFQHSKCSDRFKLWSSNFSCSANSAPLKLVNFTYETAYTFLLEPKNGAQNLYIGENV